MIASLGTRPPRRGLSLAGVLGVALALMAPLGMRGLASAADRSSPDFHWSGRVARGKTLEIRGVNGGIHAEPASGDQAEITAIKRGHRNDPDEVRIVVTEHENGVTVCTIYPGQDGECRPGGGKSSSHDNDVSVDYTVRVPAGVELDAHTVNGSVHATGLDGKVSVTTVNGNIEMTTKQYGEAATVNGSIVARLGRPTWDHDLAFETINGSIELTLPPSASANVRAETMNGTISSDFPLTARTGFLHHRLSGTIGKGGRELRLRSLNGTIELRDGTGRGTARGT